jgi:RNA polymerase sigma factor (sigma-70 family)
MIDNRGHWGWEFVTQRRSQFLLLARNLCGNASDAEDLLHETIVRFIQAADTGKAPMEARQCEAWLVRALRNLFTDLCRKRRVQEQGAKEPSLSAEAAPTQEYAADPIYDSITSEQVGEALDKLSPKLRETFKLHLTGKKYHEIAKLLGIPTGTVGKRIHDARERLHELLKPSTPT